LRSLSTFDIFFTTTPATPELYTLSLHDALPIFGSRVEHRGSGGRGAGREAVMALATLPRATSTAGPEVLFYDGGCGLCHRAVRRSEEHTSELQSRFDLVCRLLLEKKKTIITNIT